MSKRVNNKKGNRAKRSKSYGHTRKVRGASHGKHYKTPSMLRLLAAAEARLKAMGSMMKPFAEPEITITNAITGGHSDRGKAVHAPTFMQRAKNFFSRKSS